MRMRTHKFERNIVCTKPIPEVFITPAALEDMRILTDAVDTEIGWLGNVVRQGHNYVVDEIYLLKQKVHRTTTELDSEAIATLFEQWMQNPDGADKCNRCKFWGHSHADGGIIPSSQDDDTMEEFRKNGNDFFIRAILNKKGEMRIDVYDYANFLRFHDVEWSVVSPAVENKEEYWKQQVADKVKPYYEPAVHTNYGHHPHYGNGWRKDYDNSYVNENDIADDVAARLGLQDKGGQNLYVPKEESDTNVNADVTDEAIVSVLPFPPGSKWRLNDNRVNQKALRRNPRANKD